MMGKAQTCEGCRAKDVEGSTAVFILRKTRLKMTSYSRSDQPQDTVTEYNMIGLFQNLRSLLERYWSSPESGRRKAYTERSSMHH